MTSAPLPDENPGDGGAGVYVRRGPASRRLSGTQLRTQLVLYSLLDGPCPRSARINVSYAGGMTIFRQGIF